MANPITLNRQKKGERYNLLYYTTSSYKKEEIKEISKTFFVRIPDGDSEVEVKIAEVFNFDFGGEDIAEILNPNIEEMVLSKASKAYESVKVPCLVEHAGLIFADYKNESYPGGLTQPMWDVLANNGQNPEKFISELNGAGRAVIARAVVGYCDGKHIETFVGETKGTIAEIPRGERRFYWDTIFRPDGAKGIASGMTYAEMAKHKELGIGYKIQLSQSAKAMKKCLQYIAKKGDSGLFSD